MHKIFILGSLNMDLSIKTNRMPNIGETICGDSFKTCPGGKGLNQAIAAAKMKSEVIFLGAIGKDVFGKEMVNALQTWNIDTRNIKFVDNCSSGIAIIMVENANNRIILDLGANNYINKEDIDVLFKKANKDDIFLAQLENNIDSIGYALKVAKQKGLYTIVNPAPANKDILKFSDYIDLLTPNEIEILSLTDCGDNYLMGYKKLCIPSIIVTLGKDGCLLINKDGSKRFSTIRVNAIDSTGAGDTFNGVLASFLAKSSCINDAIHFALLAASISVTRRGSSISSPTLEEITKLGE